MIKATTVRELRVGNYIRFKQPWNGVTCEGKLTKLSHEAIWAGGCRLYTLSVGPSKITLLGNTPIEILTGEDAIDGR